MFSSKFDHIGDDGRPHKLGIFGGTFDPIHLGHLAMAEQARFQLELDGVLFIPAGVPVFKLLQKVTSGQQRLDMCRLATQDNPAFDVSDHEVLRQGNTYTVDTLRLMREFFPENVKLYFITGADAFDTLSKWKAPREMARLATFVGITRPGYPVTQEVLGTLHDDLGFSLEVVEAPGIDVSSSYLRRCVADGKTIRYLVPSSVLAYIADHGLYNRG